MKEVYAKAVRAALTLPDDIARLRAQARADLWQGPFADNDYPGFEAACCLLRRWCEENVCPLWYSDECGDISKIEPVTEDMDAWSYREISRRQVIVAIFGSELAEYLS